jgi:hypothetical protein
MLVLRAEVVTTLNDFLGVSIRVEFDVIDSRQ